MKIRLRHNLTDQELKKAIASLATASGLETPVLEALQKATCDCGPREPRDPAVRHLLAQFRDLYRQARRDLLEAIASIVHGDVKKAISSDPLTKEQLRRIQQAIRDRFEFIAAQMQDDYQPPVEILRRWQERRWVAGNVTAKDFAISVRPEDRLIHNAFVFGRLHQALEAGGSYEEILKLALGLPLKKPDVHAIAIAEQHAASYITALGDDLAKDAAGIIAKRNRLTIHKMVLDTLGQKLPAKVLDAEAKQALGIVTREKTVDFWTELKSELHHAMEDKSRDWDRVAYYELHDAKGQGQAMQLLEEFGAKTLVYKMPLPTACPQCKHAYLTEDGTPRLFHLPEMMEWGNNVGRKPHQVRGGKVIPGGGRADGAEGLKAVAGQMHPFCSCLGPYPFSGFEPWAEQARHNMGTEPMAKAHVKQHTRRSASGAVSVVKEHEDRRQANAHRPISHETLQWVKTWVWHHQSEMPSDKVIEELTQYTPKQSVLLYRAHLKKQKENGKIESWTKNKAYGEYLVEYGTQNGDRRLKAKTHFPNEILADLTMLPDIHQGEVTEPNQDEVIVVSGEIRKRMLAVRARMGIVYKGGIPSPLQKSHIKQYTRADGTLVKEHDDSRLGKHLWPMENGDHAVKSPLKVYGGNADHSSPQASLDAERKNQFELVDMLLTHEKKLAGVEKVPVKDLHSLQTTVGKDKATKRSGDFDEKKSAEDLPVVFRFPDGKLVLKDGNHRAVGALIAGKSHIAAKVYDMVPNVKKSLAIRHLLRKSQHRAKKGGEVGQNGEFYEGGKFLPSTRLPKQSPTARTKATKRMEYEPNKWGHAPEEGQRTVWGRIREFVDHGNLKNGKAKIAAHFLEEGHPAIPYYFGTKKNLDKFIRLWNKGERWYTPKKGK